MSIKQLFFYSFLQWLCMTLLKVWFFNNQVLSNPGLQSLVFWLLSAVLGAAIVRRLGILNYLEVFFIVIVWFLVDLFFDLIITSAYTGYKIFTSSDFWIVYLVLGLSVIFLHKKRHIQVRKEQHAHRHGHH